jgi:hypothetical protein
MPSLIRKHPWLVVAILVFGVLFVVFVASFFLPFWGSLCEENEKTHKIVCANYRFGLFVLLWIFVFIEEHNAAVTAVATLVMAAFTGTLWFVTKRSVDLGRAEFEATHRPKIFVQTVTVTDKGTRTIRDGQTHRTPARAIITIANGGDNPAFIIEWRAIIYYQNPDAAFTPGLDVEPLQRPKINAHGISPGEFEDIGHTQMHAVDDDWETFLNEGGRMFFIGRIAYQGVDKIKRNTGFCREYDPNEAGAWRPVKESEYEYTY